MGFGCLRIDFRNGKEFFSQKVLNVECPVSYYLIFFMGVFSSIAVPH